jgi:hypothetical protein
MFFKNYFKFREHFFILFCNFTFLITNIRIFSFILFFTHPNKPYTKYPARQEPSQMNRSGNVFLMNKRTVTGLPDSGFLCLAHRLTVQPILMPVGNACPIKRLQYHEISIQPIRTKISINKHQTQSLIFKSYTYDQ